MIKIVKALPQDAREITEVRYKTWLATYPNDEYNINREDIDKLFKERLSSVGLIKTKNKISASDKSLFLVAKDNDKIIGLCQLLKDKNILGAIYILPAYHRRGIGKMFWRASLNFFTPGQDIYVDVAIYNSSAISFYNQLSFRLTGNKSKFNFKNNKSIPVLEMVLAGDKW